MAAKIYNINAGASFVDVLAEHFLKYYKNQPEELANVLFLLPNRRACQSLSEAFVRLKGLEPTILPQIVPIADIEEDEVFLTGQSNILQDLSPEITKTERVFIFSKLISQKPELGFGHLSLAQAYALAENLAALIDLSYNENLDFSRLSEIVPAEFAAHWQESLELLKIITEYWPQILRERNKADTVKRRNQLLEAELKLWQQSQTKQKIVVAGSTAAFPLQKQLVKTVLNLPNGEVWLYGLDSCLEDSGWAQIDENHPQFELKELLDYLQIDRGSIINLPQKTFSSRERLVSEIMRPAAASAEWRSLSSNPLPKENFEGIHLLNCDDIRQEAQAIALLIRNTLEMPEKTAALATVDRNLARRVVSELKRWNIVADDSAGQPLSLTPIGVYLRQIINVLENDFSQVSLLSLLKHPFTSCGQNPAIFNQKVRKLELSWRKKEDLSPELAEFITGIKEIFAPLCELYRQGGTDLQQFFTSHIKTAELLADTDIKTGDKIIWKNDAGAVASKFVSDFMQNCVILGKIKPHDYLAFLESMLIEQNVRVRYGMHPRVKILGPIEARLTQFDVTIIGEVNEGVWPKLPTADLWMSRPMKKDFGFPLPERNIGVAAADFAHLLNAKKVYLTRAERVDGTPTNKSRWWLRFETILAANFGNQKEDKAKYEFLYDNKYSLWAKYLERATEQKRISAPEPRPPLPLRPRKLSAVNFEMLMRDPYTIFAKYILKLYPLEELDEDVVYRDYGNIVHAVIEKFNNIYNTGAYPPDAEQQLLKLGEAEFAANNISLDIKAFWWPKFVKTAAWLVETEKNYRSEVKKVYNEVTGSLDFASDGGKFTITAKADRIDETIDGHLNVLDYKTGKARTLKEIITGMAPQLPIEGLIAEKGGYAGIPAKKVSTLRYWRLGKEEIAANSEQSQKGLERTMSYLQTLIAYFDKETTPYYAKPNPHDAPDYSDYDHLSRFLEWSVRDEQAKENDSDEN